MFCEKCGNQMDDNEKFCPTCGSKVTKEDNVDSGASQEVFQSASNGQGVSNDNLGQNQTYTAPIYQAQANQTYVNPEKPIVNSTPFLIWSIVNLLCCCLPLGIAGIIFVVKANGAQTQEEADKSLSTAKLLNIIGTAAGFVINIIVFIVSVSNMNY